MKKSGSTEGQSASDLINKRFLPEGGYFVPFAQFPWFREAPLGKLLNVTMPAAHHPYWPERDIDLAVESILHPGRFPLVSKAGA